MSRAILNAIEEAQTNGLATRPWVIAGLCLGLCQRCEQWMGDGCRRLGLEGGPFADWLCDAANWCQVWTERHGPPPLG